MTDPATLRAALAGTDAAALVTGLARAVKAGVPDIAALARDCLLDGRPGIRNAGALALADLRDPGAGEAIRAALRRPEVAPQFGTLVYVLHRIRAELTLGEAVLVLEKGSWEARVELSEMAGLVRLGEGEDDEALLARLVTLGAKDDETAWAADPILDRARALLGQTAPAP